MAVYLASNKKMVTFQVPIIEYNLEQIVNQCLLKALI